MIKCAEREPKILYMHHSTLKGLLRLRLKPVINGASHNAMSNQLEPSRSNVIAILGFFFWCSSVCVYLSCLLQSRNKNNSRFILLLFFHPLMITLTIRTLHLQCCSSDNLLLSFCQKTMFSISSISTSMNYHHFYGCSEIFIAQFLTMRNTAETSSIHTTAKSQYTNKSITWKATENERKTQIHLTCYPARWNLSNTECVSIGY